MALSNIRALNASNLRNPVRNVCWTLFNDDGNPVAFAGDVYDRLARHGLVKGFVFQIEICPTTIRYHLQGYIEFSTPLRFSRIKSIFRSQQVHLEQRRGTRKQAMVYCMKEESRMRSTDPYWFPSQQEFEGTSQGTRTDLLAVRQSIVGGKSIKSIADEHFSQFCRYHGGITAAYHLLTVAVKRTWKTRVTLLIGPTGCGKSHKSWELAGPEAYVKPSGHQWFTGYSGQDNVIMDDFSSGFKMSMTVLLNIMDRYPLQVRIHGGLINFVARNLYITSNTGPKHWYAGDQMEGRNMDTLYRRVDCVYLKSPPRIGAQTTLDDPRFSFDIINDPETDLTWKNKTYQ